MSTFRAISIGLLLLASWPAVVRAQVPSLLNYQGRLAVDQRAFDGVGSFKFALVNANGLQNYWGNSSDLNNDGQPDGALALAVSRGLFSVMLGDTNITGMASLPATAFTNNPIFLRVWFSDGAGPFERLIPDQRIGAVGYAILAATVPDASITAAKLAPGAVNTTNLTGVLGQAQIPILDADRIPVLDAGKLGSGTLDSNRVPVLEASKIGTGVFDSARIPGLDAAKITTGTISSARLPALDTGQIGTGILGANHIGPLDAAQITSGIFPASRLPSLDAAQITSGRFGPEFLPSNVAFKDPDLLSTSNSISANIDSINANLVAQINAQNVQIAQLTDRLNTLSTGAAALPVGTTVVSADARDTGLMTGGFTLFSSATAPPWVIGSTVNAPAPRFGQSTLFSSQGMIVWGGDLGTGTYSGAGGIYDVNADQWTAVSSVGAPGARTRHSAVWTGNQMIVWGGFSTDGFLNTGGRFTPATQLWTPVSLAGAPVERDGQVAVWTGNQMIVWGGRNGGGLLNDGALYDPAADQWNALTLPNAPEARSGATAIWTGNSMILWGGDGASGSLGTGAELVFSSSGTPLLWRSLATTSAPSARSGHTAVWTGLKMLIWGGQSHGSFMGDGAAYDPISDSWQALPTQDSPSARSGHNGIWNGKEMLVVDGDGASGAVASGAAYDPVANHWRVLTSAGSPQARSGAGAVWTGAELLVFGGRSNDQPIARLERLNPQQTWYFYRKL